MATRKNITAAIDMYGVLCAEIASLEADKKKLRDTLIEAIGVGAAEGDLFRVTISTTERETLDMAAVREKLTPQFIRAHTNVTEVTVVKATARNAQNLAA